MKVAFVISSLVIAGCASDAGRSKCTFVREEGLCEASVTVDPREPDSPDEAATLEVKWTWGGPDEVAPRVVEYRMTAQEAAWRKDAWESLGKSRCTIEEPVDGCEAGRKIVFVEAEP